MQISSRVIAPSLKPAFTPRNSDSAMPEASPSEPRETVKLSGITESAPASPRLVDVGHKRELRGAWVASVFNINFPTSQMDSAAQQQEQIVNMLDRLEDSGFNSIFFQVRPEGDALYKSALEPYSNSLTGTQGKYPGYDPLEVLVDEAHKRNIEVHAWLNPYRAKAAAKEQVFPHMAVTNPEHVHQYGAVKWMDPGAEVVQDRLIGVCTDITERYDVDGIHFDDYFYPYPNGDEPFPDDTTWAKYQSEGGTLSRADWRRSNVNKAVKSVDEAVEARKDYVRFGISPFGLPAPDRPEGTWGFDQYEHLYADTQKWMDEGWVDYLAPQLYWPTTKRGQEYEKLVDWWNDHSSDGRAIFAGNNLQAIGSKPSWTLDEYKKQVELSREHSGEGGTGNIWWHIDPVLTNKDGAADMFKNDLYAEPALTPVMPEARDKNVQAPEMNVDGREIRPKHTDKAPLKAWTVYRQEGDEWKLDHILPAATESFTLPEGTWAVAAASKHGVESQGVVVDVPA